MNSEKKVIFLFLLLIVVIISCVYIHAPKIAEDRNIQIPQSSEIETKAVDEKQDETKVFPSDVYEQSQAEAEIALNKGAVEPSENELEQNYVQNNDENTSDENIAVIEKVEKKIVEPLITTDKRYIRENGESPIEKLSLDSQRLQIELSKLMRENPIIFKRASYNVTEASEEIIVQISDILKEYPNLVIEVAGHTDAAGEAKLNKYISNERAKVVRNRLIELGIDKQRLIARGYGENIPLVKNSPKGYSRVNRRVEFNIVEE